MRKEAETNGLVFPVLEESALRRLRGLYSSDPSLLRFFEEHREICRLVVLAGGLEALAQPPAQQKDEVWALAKSRWQSCKMLPPDLSLLGPRDYYLVLTYKCKSDLRLLVAEMLLEYGANPNTAENGVITLLHYCAIDGDIQFGKLLLNHGADINITTGIEENFSALMLAAENGHAEMAQVFLQYGADPNIQDSDGKSALDIAKKNGYQDIVRIIQHTIQRPS